MSPILHWTLAMSFLGSIADLDSRGNGGRSLQSSLVPLLLLFFFLHFFTVEDSGGVPSGPRVAYPGNRMDVIKQL